MKIQFLGTGAAEGIPSFGCACDRCRLAREAGGSNARKRASVMIEAAGQRLLLDTPPEVSTLLDRAGVFDLSAVFLSHEHFDHIGGLTEFEWWIQVLPICAGYDVLPSLRLTPRLEERSLVTGFYAHTWLHFGDMTVMPFKVIHHVPCYGFVFEMSGARVVHFSDASPTLGALHRRLAKEGDVVIFHTPTFETHPHHLSVQNVISLVKGWSLRRAVITHINHHNYLHEELVEKVADYGITVAYDGLTMEV